MKTLLLIDGYSIMHRAYFALPELSTHEGTPTNAIYGFFTMLNKAIIDYKPTHLVVAFDTPVATFRKKLYGAYQIQRPKAADGFKIQVPIIKELLDIAGITRLQKEGFEADDVIATLARKFREVFERIFILTGDRDMLQLVDEKTFVIAPQKGITTSTIYTPEMVMEKYGINPSQIPDLKALMGDPSDNYSGAKGIGPKTAAKLLIDHSTVEHLLTHIDDIEPERVRHIIKEHLKNVELSKQLATLKTDLGLEADLDTIVFKGFKSDMENKLKELELYSLINRLLRNGTIGPKSPEKNKTKVKKIIEGQKSLF